MAYASAARPQRLVEHALETSTLRAVHRDRPRHDQRQPALGQQHPDHQRRDARARRHRDRLPGRRQRLGQRHRRLAGAGDGDRRERRPGGDRWPTPADDRADLVTGDVASDWDDPSGETSIQVFDAFAAKLGEAFGQADAEKRILYGFVFHEVTTTYLGSSTGLRLRHVQPTGHYGCTGKNTELTNSAWVGGATRDFADVDAAQMAADLATRLSWGERRHRPPRWPLRHDPAPDRGRGHDDLRLREAGARNADDGQTVFSKPGGGTRIGEQIVNPGVRMYSDPSYPGRECAPVRDRRAPRRDRSSVYDNGLAPRPHRLDRRRAPRPR